MYKSGALSAQRFEAEIAKGRTFSTTSWMYDIHNAKTRKNKFMRTFGSLSTIQQDIAYLKSVDSKREVLDFKEQVMHDLLVLAILKKNGIE